LPTLDQQIDELYRGRLDQFVEARTALAKTLAGDAAKRVKGLAKPTVVPWAANQVYWRARPVYDRLVKSGAALRHAQVAALGGKKADIRAATEAHRAAIADAVKHAEQFAAAENAHPPADALMRTFEAISLTAGPLERPGRLTKPLQPAGFEALAGVKVAPQIVKKVEAKRQQEADRRLTEAEVKQAEAERRKHEAEVRKAEAALEHAKRKMAEAEAALKAKREG